MTVYRRAVAILKYLLAHTVIATIAVGSIACLCPADAAGMAAPAATHARHAHAPDTGSGAEAPASADCVHEACGSDCAQVAAPSAKVSPTVSGKSPAQPDDIEFLVPVMAGWPPAADPPRLTRAPPGPLWLSHDSPVRRFDRLLD